MKKILFLIIMISVSIQGYTQDELNTKFKPIPPKESKIKKAIPPKEIAPKIDPPPLVEKPDPLKVNPEELFKDSSLYKKEANVEGIFYRRNQYLGSFKTKSLTSTIRYRDAAFVDGDKIKVYLNDQIIVPEVSLNGEFQEFKIKLVDGINKIDFEALNEGFASPNTAEFQVFDDKGTVIEASQWNVGTGYKATIRLIKE
ncbi:MULTISPECIES: hypothetical protein [unclassified Flavobacterium]|uniref:hypothetical protein n=1 Tax=unclassified Flavobacterium TaxID=196869 RepID=UPI000F0C0397|nr:MULTISPECIES: hypothetical protein [unclassified Flavobacterium]AYN03716.1 hypothetical protein EAG11_05625 [Flavobacterium sp. 140616W15]MCD0474180.1 hypothetical protein [Flavobacterium sp. EDS]